MAIQTIWSKRTSIEIDALITRIKPDVIHAHNTFPLISPSLFWIAARHKIPTVQTLHNFRMLCVGALLLRDGYICEDCINKVQWRGVLHRCYRRSLLASAGLASMLTVHRLIGTFKNKVTRYIALNPFCMTKFIEGGLPADKIVIKPNFSDRMLKLPATERTNGLYVGRLSVEKGIGILANALSIASDVCLDIIGDGPAAKELAEVKSVRMLGKQAASQIYESMLRSKYMIIPSIWYENHPRTLVEAYSCGLPVIASRIGALAELVEDGRTGLLFSPGSSEDLAKKIIWAETHPDEMLQMGKNARTEYDKKYSPEINYRQLIAVYDDAIRAAATSNK